MGAFINKLAGNTLSERKGNVESYQRALTIGDSESALVVGRQVKATNW